MLRLTTLTSVLALMATGLAAEEIKVGVSPGE
ncbi:MAG: metal ABC transporter substrate-binding protein, partial [Tateyamaria sp.]